MSKENVEICISDSEEESDDVVIIEPSSEAPSDDDVIEIVPMSLAPSSSSLSKFLSDCTVVGPLRIMSTAAIASFATSDVLDSQAKFPSGTSNDCPSSLVSDYRRPDFDDVQFEFDGHFLIPNERSPEEKANEREEFYHFRIENNESQSLPSCEALFRSVYGFQK